MQIIKEMLLFWKKIKKDAPLNPGQAGERAAVDYLKERGYKILTTNFFNPRGKRLGEIDIIAEKKKCLVFVEVKTRLVQGENKDLPESNITPFKLQKLNKIARYYLNQNNLWDRSYRFDALAVEISSDYKQTKIRHLESIFF